MIDLITLALAKKAGGGGVTPEEMAAAIQSAIGTALANYYTKTETDEEFANYTPTDGVGAVIAVSMDSSYNLTVSLKNAESETLWSDTVNLPLESMVVGGSYDDGVLTLTLNNGQALDIPISDIIDGLVSENRTIAGIPLTSDITATALKSAIGASDDTLVLNAEASDDLSYITITGATFEETLNALKSEKQILGFLKDPADEYGRLNLFVNSYKEKVDDYSYIKFTIITKNPFNSYKQDIIEAFWYANHGQIADNINFYSLENVKPDWEAAPGSPAEILNKPTLFSGNYNDLTNKPSLAVVATSGSYNDLSNKPTIPTLPQNIVTGANGGSPIQIVVRNTTPASGTASNVLTLVTG